jgi:hypothetical protein
LNKKERLKCEKFLLDDINTFEGPFNEKQLENIKDEIKKLSDCELAVKCEFTDYLWGQVGD